ncbi:nuclear transport factor 2 family protein [Thermomonospora cellulosilytica]|uniref:SnoaL-like domain-containing protein n=1 Tax=Thermomonospora cellulosilytica TaxID=1411118 RepID=A0A7W3N396_9ACTN|nr:nuclear transport factor 2 family protein [Thermomonospora cellulosilytica]MBA9006744.1 hypothetical protein [Thermomonospora cellulosilytica]
MSERRRLALPALLLSAALTGTACSEQPSPQSSASPTPPSTAVAGVHPAARAYVDAVNRRDLNALVDAFAPDGRVVDVSRTIAGRDAIRAWADAEVIGGTLRVLSIAGNRADGQRLLVHWAPSGSGGWRAHYDFTVTGDRIAVADLQYA